MRRSARPRASRSSCGTSRTPSRKRPLIYDKGGDAHYDVTSAFIKSMRGSDPDAAVYWLAAMLEARRGPALHRAADGRSSPPRTSATPTRARCWSRSRRRRRSSTSACPEARLNLAQAAIYLARAPKSNASYVAINEASKDVREGGNARPPRSLRDGSWAGRQLGNGEGYVYPHSDPSGFEVDYLPDELKGRKYYRPTGSGEEKEEHDGG